MIHLDEPRNEQSRTIFRWIIWKDHLDGDERCTNKQASAKYCWSSNLLLFLGSSNLILRNFPKMTKILRPIFLHTEGRLKKEMQRRG